MNNILSPYGGEEILVEKIHAEWIVQQYKIKCGIDVSEFFPGIEWISLYQCTKTEYRYWKPYSIAGDENFYKALALASNFYYQKDRWEYSIVRNFLNKNHRVLEIGCGRGYFLKSIEGLVHSGLGIEFNKYAIDNKVTTYPIREAKIEDIARENEKFDFVFSFQVLEHIVNPREFIQACVDVLKPGGKLALSTPNYSSVMAQIKSDCFDLPPHHMGHYTKDTFKNISDVFGLKLLSVYCEPRSFDFQIPVMPETEKKLIFKIYRKLIAVLSRVFFRLTKESGHTVVAIYEL